MTVSNCRLRWCESKLCCVDVQKEETYEIEDLWDEFEGHLIPSIMHSFSLFFLQVDTMDALNENGILLATFHTPPYTIRDLQIALQDGREDQPEFSPSASLLQSADLSRLLIAIG